MIIKEEAHRDSVAAFDYYESCQEGLGERFVNALLNRYNDLSEHPQYYSYIVEDSKRVLRDVKLESFPYVVVFEITESKEVVVYAVHNTHKDPSNKTTK